MNKIIFSKKNQFIGKMVSFSIYINGKKKGIIKGESDLIIEHSLTSYNIEIRHLWLKKSQRINKINKNQTFLISFNLSDNQFFIFSFLLFIFAILFYLTKLMVFSYLILVTLGILSYILGFSKNSIKVESSN